MKAIPFLLCLAANLGAIPLLSAEVLAKNSPVKDARRAMKSGHFEASGIEAYAEGAELSVWGVGEGRLLLKYSAQTGKIQGMVYWLSVQGPKTGEALSFEVRSFDTASGQMQVETRQSAGDAREYDKNESAKCGRAFVEMERMMRANGYGGPEMRVSGEENDLTVWGLNCGLLITAYRKDTGNITGLTYSVCVPGGDVSKIVSFKVDSFVPKSGLLTIQVRPPKYEKTEIDKGSHDTSPPKSRRATPGT